MRKRNFYAIAYAYGRCVENNGNRPDQVHIFRSVADRTRFIGDQTDRGIDVDALAATHPEVKKALRYAARGYDWPQSV